MIQFHSTHPRIWLLPYVWMGAVCCCTMSLGPSHCTIPCLHRMAEAQAHASLGYIYELLRDTDKAIDHYERRLRIALDVIDKGAEARSYCSIGNCLRAIMQPEKALECYNRVSWLPYNTLTSVIFLPSSLPSFLSSLPSFVPSSTIHFPFLLTHLCRV